VASDFELIEMKQKQIRKVNSTYLSDFEKWLKNKGLTEKTIKKHVSNVDFYINEYLCYNDAYDVKEGCYLISSFLGDWFPRKAMWSSCAAIKATTAGLKKFYMVMLENNIIDQGDYDSFCETVKEEMPDWLDNMKRYDDMADDYFI